MNILPLLDRPIAFQRSFIRLEMGVTAALFLSQLTYWTNRTTDDGWVYKTQDEWEEKQGFHDTSRRARAKNYVVSASCWNVNRACLPGCTTKSIMMCCASYLRPHTRMRKNHIQVRGKPPGLYVENQQTFLQRILQRLLLMVNRLTPTPNNLPTRE